MPQQPRQFTTKSVSHAAPGRHHTGLKGLYLYVSPDEQVRRWVYRFTSPASGKVTETGLGMVVDVSLADARDRADALRKQIVAGTCPIQVKRQVRAEKAAQVTFKEAAERWIATHKRAWKGGDASTTIRAANNLLHRHGKPLAKIAVGQITPDDVQRALQPLWDKSPEQARTALRMWTRVFDFAKAHNMRTGDNPASWRGCHEYRFPKQRKDGRGHYEALPYEQMPAFIKALREQQNQSSAAIALEFTILTACRSCETLNMEWSEVDLDKRLWTIPGARMKAGTEHRVPLSDQAIAILERQRFFSDGSPFVFPGERPRRGTEPTAMNNRSMWALLQRMKVAATTHGMRSSFRDWAGDETDFAREDVEACLAHKVGNGVEQAYRRRNALEKRRVIMAAWANYCG
jgi:integrase